MLKALVVVEFELVVHDARDSCANKEESLARTSPAAVGRPLRVCFVERCLERCEKKRKDLNLLHTRVV